MKASKQIAVGFSTAFILFVLLCAVLLLRPSLARRSLPWGASDIHEHYVDSRFGSDFERCLRASTTERGFREYAARLGLDRVYSEAEHHNLGLLWPSCDEPWWDPPESMEGALFRQDDEDYFVLAKYEDGRVYFAAVCW